MSKLEEVWKEIPNTGGLCKISSYGRYKRFDKRKNEWIELKGFFDNRGNIDVGVFFLTGKKICSISRLVGEIFVENDEPEEKIYVVHKDGDKKNNHASNLKWVTSKEWFGRTHWARLESREKTLELMKEKALEKAKAIENNAESEQMKRELIKQLDPNVETWAFLPDSDNKYSVSSFGRVKSHCYNEEGKLRKLLYEAKTGGLKVELSVGGKKSKMLVHRLIAEVFVENDDPINKTMVTHLDGNKENNRAENLKWMNHEEWMERNKKRYKTETDADWAKRGNSHLNMESARLIRKLSAQGVTNVKLAKLFRISAMQVVRIKRNENWKEIETVPENAT